MHPLYCYKNKCFGIADLLFCPEIEGKIWKQAHESREGKLKMYFLDIIEDRKKFSPSLVKCWVMFSRPIRKEYIFQTYVPDNFRREFEPRFHFFKRKWIKSNKNLIYLYTRNRCVRHKKYFSRYLYRNELRCDRWQAILLAN